MPAILSAIGMHYHRLTNPRILVLNRVPNHDHYETVVGALKCSTGLTGSRTTSLSLCNESHYRTQVTHSQIKIPVPPYSTLSLHQIDTFQHSVVTAFYDSDYSSSPFSLHFFYDTTFLVFETSSHSAATLYRRRRLIPSFSLD